jgi:hypothetical protein
LYCEDVLPVWECAVRMEVLVVEEVVVVEEVE